MYCFGLPSKLCSLEHPPVKGEVGLQNILTLQFLERVGTLRNLNIYERKTH